jgi:hypothetical protein
VANAIPTKTDADEDFRRFADGLMCEQCTPTLALHKPAKGDEGVKQWLIGML